MPRKKEPTNVLMPSREMYVIIQQWFDGLIMEKLIRETRASAVERGHIGHLNGQISDCIKRHNEHVKFYSR